MVAAQRSFPWMAMLCPKCKALSDEDAAVCQSCGHRPLKLEHRIAPYIVIIIFVSLAVLALALIKC